MWKLDDQVLGALYPRPTDSPLAAPATLSALPITAGSLYPAEHPVWGPGELIFLRANGTIRQFGLCVITPVWDSTNLTYTYNATEVPNTANLGRMLAVCLSAGGMSSGQYGWFLVSGITPVNCNASVAADTTWGIAAAGQGGANGAGKQVLNSRIVTPATQTVSVTATRGASGDTKIEVPNTYGFIVGGYLSGTGVGASAKVASVDPLGRYIIADVANSADVSGNSITVTYNNGTIYYNVAHMNRSFAQGAIT